MDLYNLGSYYQTLASGGLSGSYLSGVSGLLGGYLPGSSISGSYPAGMLSGLPASTQIAPVYAKFADALQKTLSERQTFQKGQDVVLSFPPEAAVDHKESESRSRSDMTLEEYKKYICDKISALPVSNSCRANCSGMLVLKEEAFVNMQKDPAYEKEVLSGLQKEFQAQYSCYAPKFGLRVIGGSADESYREGLTAKSTSEESGDQKSRREERQGQIDTQMQLGRGGSLAERLASNRAGRLQERMVKRQGGFI